MPEIRVLVAESDPVVSRLLAERLDQEPDIRIVALASDGPEAVRLARQRQPAVVLTDMELPGLDGIGVTCRIREDLPHCAVVALATTHGTAPLFAAIRAGAMGYLPREAAVEQILVAVRTAARGEGFLEAASVAEVMHELA